MNSPHHMTRRSALRLIGWSALAAPLMGCASRATGTAAGASLAESVCFYSTRQMADAVASGELSSVVLVEACLERIDAVNPVLNAVVQLDREGAIAQARAADAARARGHALGPLHGVPMTIKDSFDTAGMVTTYGTNGRRGFVPETDATVVRRLREAGAILLGKTNTPEFTLDFDTRNLVYGQTRNPHDPSRSPGGSSGGAGAIVAAGGVPFDIGSDYGGSIRLPAHFNGICGIKPSAGRVPRTGHAFPFGGFLDTFQVVGPLARTVDDLELLLALIKGPDGIDPGAQPLTWGEPAEVRLPGMRGAWYADNGIATPTPETQRAVRAAARALADAGVVMSEERPTGIERTLEVVLPLYFWDGGATVRRLLQQAGTVEHGLQMFTEGQAIPHVQLDAAHAVLDHWRSEMLGFVTDCPLIVAPVNTSPAFPAGFATDEEMLARFSYTFAYNVTGWPVVVVPAGWSETGLPIGVQIIAGPGREDIALAAAAVVEKALAAYRRPPI